MIQPGDRIQIVTPRNFAGYDVPDLEDAILRVQEVDIEKGELLWVKAGGRIFYPEAIKQVEVEVREVATATGN